MITSYFLEALHHQSFFFGSDHTLGFVQRSVTVTDPIVTDIH